MKLRAGCTTGENRKPLSSFIASNVERDEDGSFRIPSFFLDKFGSSLSYHLQIKCNNLMWHAIYDNNKKKIRGLYDFLRFYDLRMYSVVIFDYFGCGKFVAKCYTHNATVVVNPTVEPDDFFKNEKSRYLTMDRFVYGHNNLEIEKLIAISSYNSIKESAEEFKLEVKAVDNMQGMQYMELEKDLEDLYKNWKGMDKIYLTLGIRMWEIEVRCDVESCTFGSGWYKFLKELDISTGDVIAMNIAESPDNVLACIFKKEELIFEKEAGIILSVYICIHHKF